MAATPHTRHRLTWRKRAAQHAPGRLLLSALAAVADVGHALATAHTTWKRMPVGTRSASSWVAVIGIGAAVLLPLSEFRNGGFAAVLVLGIATLLVIMICEGGAEQLRPQPAIVDTSIVYRTTAHCGCEHEWMRRDGELVLYAVRQVPQCAQVVTV